VTSLRQGSFSAAGVRLLQLLTVLLLLLLLLLLLAFQLQQHLLLIEAVYCCQHVPTG
jgi:hypothetical protein